VVKDVTASYSDEHMHAALDVNIPNYASAVVTTNEVIDSVSSLQTGSQREVLILTHSDRCTEVQRVFVRAHRGGRSPLGVTSDVTLERVG
jgi:hypothetical protein